MKSINIKKNKSPTLIKISHILTSLFTLAFLVVGTVLVILYAKGYRFNIHETVVERTGVISIDSTPARATLFVDGENKGRTPKSVGSVTEGTVEVRLELPGYHTWQKNIPVEIEKSSPYYAYLFRTDPEPTVVFESQMNIIEAEVVHAHDALLAVTLERDIESDETTLNVYRYPINRPFWNRNATASLIYSEKIVEQKDFKIMPSPDGAYLIVEQNESTDLTLSFTNELSPSGVREAYYISMQTSETEAERLILRGFTGDEYSYRWAPDSKHLIISSQKEIYSFNIEKEVIMLLEKDVTEIETPYFISRDGYFYTYEQTDETIVRRTLAGGPVEPLIELTEEIGTVANFVVPENSLGLYLETETEAYWHDAETESLDLVSSIDENYQFLSYSPDGYNFLYKAEDSINIYTFFKKPNDHLTQIGSRKIEIGDNCSNFKWANSSTHILFTCTEQFDYTCIIDIDGDNFYILHTNNNDFAVMSSDLKYLYVRSDEVVSEDLNTDEDEQPASPAEERKKIMIIELLLR